MNRKQKIIISITGIFIVLLALVGLTYAYFLTRVQGNTNSNSISVTTKYLALTYGDGTNAVLDGVNIEPGVTLEKKDFTVTNTGNGTVNDYAVILEDFAIKYINAGTFTTTNGVEITHEAGETTTLVNSEDMEVLITCTSYKNYGEENQTESGTCSNLVGELPQKEGTYEILDEVSESDKYVYGILPEKSAILLTNDIEPGITQKYELTIRFVDNGDQSDDMNKSITGRLNIIDTNNTVDIEGKVEEYSVGDYVQINSKKKTSVIYSDGTYKLMGIEVDNHNIKLCNSETIDCTKTNATLNKDIIIEKGSTAGISGNTITITDTSSTLTIDINNGGIDIISLNNLSTYTNLADTSSADWYSSHTLVITSAEISQSNMTVEKFVSNAIPVQAGDVIRIKGRLNSHVLLGVYTDAAATSESKVFSARVLNRTKDETGSGVMNAVTITEDARDSEIKTYEYTFAYTDDNAQHYNIKAGTQYYIRASAGISGSEDNIVITVNEEIDGDTKYSPRWYALGDSITEGYISSGTPGSATSSVSPYDAWVYKVAKKYGYARTNYGIGGTGYVDVGGADFTNAKDHVDNIDFANADLVTLAYGINDWKGKQNLDEMKTNMKYVIDDIISENSSCEIFVITPLNAWNLGTAETNWGLNYEGENASGPGLQQIYELEKEVVNSYGGKVHLIDMTHVSFITNDNIKEMMPDGYHPSIECHTLMADAIGKYIANYIN